MFKYRGESLCKKVAAVVHLVKAIFPVDLVDGGGHAEDDGDDVLVELLNTDAPCYFGVQHT